MKCPSDRREDDQWLLLLCRTDRWLQGSIRPKIEGAEGVQGAPGSGYSVIFCTLRFNGGLPLVPLDLILMKIEASTTCDLEGLSA